MNVLVACYIVIAHKAGKVNNPNYKLTFQGENDCKSSVFLTNVNGRVFGEALKFHAWHLNPCYKGLKDERTKYVK